MSPVCLRVTGRTREQLVNCGTSTYCVHPDHPAASTFMTRGRAVLHLSECSRGHGHEMWLRREHLRVPGHPAPRWSRRRPRAPTPSAGYANVLVFPTLTSLVVSAGITRTVVRVNDLLTSSAPYNAPDVEGTSRDDLGLTVTSRHRSGGWPRCRARCRWTQMRVSWSREASAGRRSREVGRDGLDPEQPDDLRRRAGFLRRRGWLIGRRREVGPARRTNVATPFVPVGDGVVPATSRCGISSTVRRSAILEHTTSGSDEGRGIEPVPFDDGYSGMARRTTRSRKNLGWRDDERSAFAVALHRSVARSRRRLRRAPHSRRPCAAAELLTTVRADRPDPQHAVNRGIPVWTRPHLTPHRRDGPRRRCRAILLRFRAIRARQGVLLAGGRRIAHNRYALTVRLRPPTARMVDPNRETPSRRSRPPSVRGEDRLMTKRGGSPRPDGHFGQSKLDQARQRPRTCT